VAEKQGQRSDLPLEWHQAYADWGRRLLREHPNGLGKEPDFTKDGNARLLWSMDGFVVQQRAFQAVGKIDETPFGDRSFSRHPQSLVEQVLIAQWMFPLAQKCWEEAKAEADERARQDREIARAAQERRLEIDRFSAEVDAIDTTKELESRAQGLRDQVEEVRQSNSQVNITLLQDKLAICYRRMIELERRTSKSTGALQSQELPPQSFSVSLASHIQWGILITARAKQTAKGRHPSLLPGSTQVEVRRNQPNKKTD
jgi:hypothetical protein